MVTDPAHPPKVGDSLEETAQILRSKTFAEYFTRVFAPYYLKRLPNATVDSLIAQNRLDVIGEQLRTDPDYYCLTNSDDLILDHAELGWLEKTLGTRIAVYDHGGHLGNLGDRQQAADMLAMLDGRWQGRQLMRTAHRLRRRRARARRMRDARSCNSITGRPKRPRPTTRRISRSMQGLQAAAAAAATLATPQASDQAGERSSSAAAAGDARRCAVPQDLRSVGTPQPLHLSIQRPLRRGAVSARGERLSAFRADAGLRGGMHSFFANLTEIDSVINYTLQGRLHRTVRSFGRFVINTTLGIGGLFDIAGRLNIAYEPTGFGTTLAKWGMHPGPYLVMPLLGPSTFREGVGYGIDYGTEYVINFGDLYRGGQSWGLGVTNAIDQRANVDFRYYSTGSPFEYETIRFLYMRKQLIEDAGLHKSKPVPKPKPDEPAGK